MTIVPTPVDTHAMFSTVCHQHLDGFLHSLLGEYPDASLNLVQCADGRWFLEVDGGLGDTRFDGLAGVSSPYVSPYVEPAFYPSHAAAVVAATEAISQVYPHLALLDLPLRHAQYFDED